MTSTDLPAVVSLAHPNVAPLLSLLFCKFMFNLCSMVTLGYLRQNCHFLQHDFYFVFGFFALNILTLRRVSASFYVSQIFAVNI